MTNAKDAYISELQSFIKDLQTVVEEQHKIIEELRKELEDVINKDYEVWIFNWCWSKI